MDRKKSLALLLLCLLTGCATGEKRGDIRSENNRKLDINLNANYQALLKCVNDNGIKPGQADMCCGVNSHIYSELQKAEVSVKNPSDYYFALLELSAISKNQTRITAYGIGNLGDKYISNWDIVLKECQPQ